MIGHFKLKAMHTMKLTSEEHEEACKIVRFFIDNDCQVEWDESTSDFDIWINKAERFMLMNASMSDLRRFYEKYYK